jgi:hypothetical protein
MHFATSSQLNVTGQMTHRIMKRRSTAATHWCAVVLAALTITACTGTSHTEPNPPSSTVNNTKDNTAPQSPATFEPAGWVKSSPIPRGGSRGFLADAVRVGDSFVMVGDYQSASPNEHRVAAAWVGTGDQVERWPGQPFKDTDVSVRGVAAFDTTDPTSTAVIAVGVIADEVSTAGGIWEINQMEFEDRQSWTRVYTGEPDTSVDDVVTVNDQAIAVGGILLDGQRRPVVLRRKDTGEWQSTTLPDVPAGDVAIANITFARGTFVVAGTLTDSGRSRPVVWSSSTGVSWQRVELPVNDNSSEVDSVGYATGHFLVTGRDGKGEGVIWVSLNSLNWTATPALIDGEPVQDVRFGEMFTGFVGDQEVAVIAALRRPTAYVHLWSPDGSQKVSRLVDGSEDPWPTGLPIQLIGPPRSGQLWTLLRVAGGFVIERRSGRSDGPGGALPDAAPATRFNTFDPLDDAIIFGGDLGPVRAGNVIGVQATLYRANSDTKISPIPLGDDVNAVTKVVANGRGGHILLGAALSNTSDTDLNDVWIAQVNPRGEILTAVTFGGPGLQVGTQLISFDSSWAVTGYSHPDGEPGSSQSRLWVSEDLVDWTPTSPPNTEIGSALDGGCALSDGRLLVLGRVRSSDLTARPTAWLLDNDEWTVIDLGVDSGHLRSCQSHGDGVMILGSNATETVVWTGLVDELTSTVFPIDEQPNLIVHHTDVHHTDTTYLVGRQRLAGRWQPALWAASDDGDWRSLIAPTVQPFSSWSINDAAFTKDGHMMFIGQLDGSATIWTSR